LFKHQLFKCQGICYISDPPAMHSTEQAGQKSKSDSE